MITFAKRFLEKAARNRWLLRGQRNRERWKGLEREREETKDQRGICMKDCVLSRDDAEKRSDVTWRSYCGDMEIFAQTFAFLVPSVTQVLVTSYDRRSAISTLS